ncbi:MAG: GtrA family protein [Patescibacteria group bacterium]
MNYRLVKYLCVSCIGASLNYFGGVVLSDIIGLQYFIAGLIVLPVSFAIGFYLNKNWVFKTDHKPLG